MILFHFLLAFYAILEGWGLVKVLTMFFGYNVQCAKYIQCTKYKVHTMCNVQSTYNVQSTKYIQCTTLPSVLCSVKFLTISIEYPSMLLLYHIATCILHFIQYNSANGKKVIDKTIFVYLAQKIGQLRVHFFVQFS